MCMVGCSFVCLFVCVSVERFMLVVVAIRSLMRMLVGLLDCLC